MLEPQPCLRATPITFSEYYKWLKLKAKEIGNCALKLMHKFSSLVPFFFKKTNFWKFCRKQNFYSQTNTIAQERNILFVFLVFYYFWANKKNPKKSIVRKTSHFQSRRKSISAPFRTQQITTFPFFGWKISIRFSLRQFWFEFSYYPCYTSRGTLCRVNFFKCRRQLLTAHYCFVH